MMPARRMSDTVARKVAMIHATLWVKSDVDAEQRRAVGALGARSQRDADAREPEEGAEADDREEVVTTATRSLAWKISGCDLEAEVERRRVRLHRQVGAHEELDRDGEPGQQLREADGDDHQDQPRRPREAADDHELDRRPEHDRGDQRDREREPERPRLERRSATP